MEECRLLPDWDLARAPEAREREGGLRGRGGKGRVRGVDGERD